MFIGEIGQHLSISSYVYVIFFVGPLWWNLLMWDSCADVIAKGKVCDASRWTPLTLQGGAMFHLAFGALLGATSWNKHKENINGNGDKPTT